jgi:hypothetical protein
VFVLKHVAVRWSMSELGKTSSVEAMRSPKVTTWGSERPLSTPTTWGLEMSSTTFWLHCPVLATHMAMLHIFCCLPRSTSRHLLASHLRLRAFGYVGNGSMTVATTEREKGYANTRLQAPRARGDCEMSEASTRPPCIEDSAGAPI